DGVFRVKEVRNCIDDIFLPSQVIDTRWVRFVPIKVNIFIWRARQDCLPTRVNLVRRGINVDSCVCPICSTGEDEINHILFRCNLAQQHGGIYGGLGIVSFFREFFPEVPRDHAPVAVDFNAQDYATLVAHPSPFQKFPEAFMYMVRLSRHYTLDEETYPWFLHKNGEEMDIFAFIHTPNPTKVRIVERQQNEEASVERLFDEGGSGNQTEQGDSTRGEPNANIQPVVEAANIAVENVAPVQTPNGTYVGGKSRYALHRLLVGAVLNVKVRVVSIPTLHFVTTFVSTTPEREGEDHADSVTKPNLRTIGALRRFVISSDSSHHSGTNVAEAEVDSLVRLAVLIMTTATTLTSTTDPTSVAKEKLVEPSPFGAGSSSAGETDTTMGVFSDLTGSDFLVGTIRTMVDEFAHLKFFASVRGMEHDQLFTEFNVKAKRQMSLSVEVRMRAEYNVKEKRRLKSVVERHDELLKVREKDIASLKAWLLLREAEAIRLCAEASNFETVKKSLWGETNALRERNIILEKERNALDVKLTLMLKIMPLLLLVPLRSRSFQYLVELSRHYTLDEETYPRFLHKNGEGGDGYLCFHPHPESYQKASVERLFDEGGSGNQTAQEDSTRAVLNAEVGVVAIPTLHFVTTSVSTTPEREGGDHANSVTKPNLRTIGALR
nr:RNA-directed DNA polymerase, eukaryota [Tanacetum cinerariifolium]